MGFSPGWGPWVCQTKRRFDRPRSLFFDRYFPLQTGKIGYFRPFRGTPGSAHHLPVWLMPSFRRLFRVCGSFRRLFRAVPGRVAGRRRRRTAVQTAFRTAFRLLRGTYKPGSQACPRNECGTRGRPLWGCLFRPLRPDCACGRPTQGRPIPTHIPGPAFHARHPGRPMDHMQHGMQYRCGMQED